MFLILPLKLINNLLNTKILILLWHILLTVSNTLKTIGLLFSGYCLHITTATIDISSEVLIIGADRGTVGFNQHFDIGLQHSNVETFEFKRFLPIA